MKRLKNTLKTLFPWLPYRVKQLRGRDIAKNVFKTDYPRNALMVYLTNPFFSAETMESHQNFWQMVEIAKELKARGYNVDVIDYYNKYTRPKKQYDLLLNIQPTESMLFRKNLKPDAIKIAYLTVSNPSYGNAAEQKRLDALQDRRGVALKLRRDWPLLSKEIENYDAAFMIGNSFNYRSYTDEFRMPPVHYIRNNGYVFDFQTDYSKKDPKKFLFFASSGQVHKGLDLLLEVFSKENFSCELYVCSLFQEETDFLECYKKELYETSNIHAIGFINIRAEEFRNLAETCTYAITPSCSEARVGAMLTVMSAGLIPICSRDCGYDEDEAIQLEDCTLETIEKTVLEYSAKDHAWIVEQSQRAKQIVAQRYTQQDYLNSLRYALDQVIK